MRPVPAEVDFAARYLTGDWTAESDPPKIEMNQGFGASTGLLPPIWMWLSPDGKAYSAEYQYPAGHYLVQWEDDDELTCSAHVRDEGSGVFAFLMWDGPEWRVVGRARLVIHDTGYEIVDLP